MSDAKESNQCHVCKRVFLLKSCLKAHKLEHKEKKIHPVNDIREAVAFEKVENYRGKETLEIFTKEEDTKVKSNRLYKCGVCGKRFAKEERLKVHVVGHRFKQNPYCTKCNQKCSRPSILRNHLRKHALRDKHRCSYCDKGFLSQKSCDQHMLKHKAEDIKNSSKKEISLRKYCCLICSETFPKASDLTEHYKIHKNLTICVKCGKKFVDLDSLKKHMRRHTAKKTPIQCEICGKVVTHSRFNDHLRIHTGEKPHKCVECGKCFTQIAHLRTHMKSHVYRIKGEREFVCDVCGKTLLTIGTLREHHKGTHFGNEHFKCERCQAECCSYSNISHHYQTCHPEEFVSCKICNKKFISNNVLCTHYVMHSEEELKLLDDKTLEIISERRKLNRALKKDFINHRTKSVLKKENKLRRKRNLIKSVYAVDSNGFYKCSYCSKTFKRTLEIRVHERLHTGERPYTCTICHRSFVQQTHLKTHVTLLHSGGVKPFICDICGKSFAIQTYLYNHKKIHSRDLNAPPRRKKAYECYHCGNKYSSKKKCVVHQSYCLPSAVDGDALKGHSSEVQDSEIVYVNEVYAHFKEDSIEDVHYKEEKTIENVHFVEEESIEIIAFNEDL